MKCEFCDGQTVKRKVRKQHWLEGRLYLVENVEAEVCSECGERYFHATILDRIDEMLKAEHSVKERLSVEVVSFA
ncbi:MAG: YgiT-type zinc finger protein [Acidobacteria bacterium]|nr:YgiT-type zinc finger protein [Acidobacteriota bacterium]